MTEDQAIEWIERKFGRVIQDRLAQYVDLLFAENERQNLISRSTIGSVWVRHIVDSAQLALLAPSGARRWIDVGSGAGLPGLVIAIVAGWDVVLIEPRHRRVEFLRAVADQLGLTITLAACDVRRFESCTADILSARAVAPIAQVFAMTSHLATPATSYLLPRGRSDAGAIENLSRDWHGVFHVEQSVTSTDSHILIATGVSKR